MAHILQSLQRNVNGSRVSGTRVPPRTRFALLVGHDTQEAELAGLLGLSWLVPGDQLNDTPPGSALIFELYQPAGGGPFIRTFFAAQTLDAMRDGKRSNPVRVPVYVPGCPGFDCPFSMFGKIVNTAIDPKFVTAW